MSEGTREVCHLCAGSTGGCTGLCRPSFPGPIAPQMPGPAYQPPKGCICPPTSEQTCQRWDCGRRSATTTVMR